MNEAEEKITDNCVQALRKILKNDRFSEVSDNDLLISLMLELTKFQQQMMSGHHLN